MQHDNMQLVTFIKISFTVNFFGELEIKTVELLKFFFFMLCLEGVFSLFVVLNLIFLSEFFCLNFLSEFSLSEFSLSEFVFICQLSLAHLFCSNRW